VPELKRFGTRSKIFVPSIMTFEEINKSMYEGLFSDRARTLVGGSETDLQFTIELKDAGFDVRVMGGPIHRDEAGKHFQFNSDHFTKCGLFLDLDFYTTEGLTVNGIPEMLRNAVELMWVKAERIARGVGL